MSTVRQDALKCRRLGAGKDPHLDRGKLLFRTPERWQSGRMRRFAKPLYGLTPVPRVRIPPSPPDSRNSIQRRALRVVAAAHFYITRVLARGSGCTVVAHMVSSVFIAAVASLLTVLT